MHDRSSSRVVEECPHRKSADPGETADTEAVCRLLQKLVGADETFFSKVSAAACRACCDHFCPTEKDLNPVVASLLFGLTERLIALDNHGGCDSARLRDLQNWAERSLPILLSDEDDIGPTARAPSAADATITVADICQVLPLPSSRQGPRVSNWAVGLTTAPRRQATLTQTLDSLIAAGWDNPHLFVDGDLEIHDVYRHLGITKRQSVGAWPNYYLSLQQLLEQRPAADALMIVQDDVIFPASHAVRDYVEQAVWPEVYPALVSLYCCSDYTAPQPGWSPWNDTWLYGALAFVFSRELAESFLSDERVKQHGTQSGLYRKAGIDSVIGAWAARQRLPVYRTTPSLVQHIGHISAIWETSRAVGVRRASTYVVDHLRPSQ